MKKNFESFSKILMLLTICVICIKPMVTTIQQESWAVKDQRSFSILSITVNQGLF
ncbi:hypothetical protein CH54_30 [Yersinia rochesterensis]|uniref:Uncharacterized protein n=1 Tax=Yersinia rochesterensis TaxID=1604335 RepID=A0ABM5SPY2_9GAMM|nr:hypothetical protein [Yersinia rochesterensis]AJI88545.1 hypothetical protein AW19_1634 [Yersinia frederiksenii Y225]AJJ36552.1 hypothetical protein CH54_30 [Yersinia rochesterensis]CRY60778.1 Uncharacterised protein [Yersinia kristensenii]